jgi:ABC-type glycerol-3-phosphate transport system permease component
MAHCRWHGSTDGCGPNACLALCVSGKIIVFTTSAFSTYGAEAAAHVVAMAPVIFIFILMQKWFIRGLTDGILKM